MNEQSNVTEVTNNVDKVDNALETKSVEDVKVSEPVTNTVIQRVPDAVPKPEVKPVNPTIVTKPEEQLCKAVDFNLFLENDSNNWIREHSGLDSYINSGNPQHSRKAMNIMRAYFLLGYHKKNTQEEVDRHQKAINRVNSLFEYDQQDKIRALMDSEATLSIVPYNNKGLLIATIKVNDSEVKIPLLITDAIIGEYSGNIDIASTINMSNFANESEFNYIDLNNFSRSPLNISGQFYSFGAPFVLSASADDMKNYGDDQRQWIKDNNGRTFTAISIDPFLSNDDYLQFLISDGPNYTTNANSTIGLIGIN